MADKVMDQLARNNALLVEVLARLKALDRIEAHLGIVPNAVPPAVPANTVAPKDLTNAKEGPGDQGGNLTTSKDKKGRGQRGGASSGETDEPSQRVPAVPCPAELTALDEYSLPLPFQKVPRCFVNKFAEVDGEEVLRLPNKCISKTPDGRHEVVLDGTCSINGLLNMVDALIELAS